MKIRSKRDENDHKAALTRIDDLWGATPGAPEFEELGVLAALVDPYENEQFPTGALDPIETIFIRMDDLGLERKDLEPCIGSRARVSEILNRKRALTLPMIRKLSDLLRIPADLLIGDYPITPKTRRKEEGKASVTAM